MTYLTRDMSMKRDAPRPSMSRIAPDGRSSARPVKLAPMRGTAKPVQLIAETLDQQRTRLGREFSAALARDDVPGALAASRQLRVLEWQKLGFSEIGSRILAGG